MNLFFQIGLCLVTSLIVLGYLSLSKYFPFKKIYLGNFYLAVASFVLVMIAFNLLHGYRHETYVSIPLKMVFFIHLVTVLASAIMSVADMFFLKIVKSPTILILSVFWALFMSLVLWIGYSVSGVTLIG